MAEVTLRGVEKRWGAFTAVRQLDLDVEDREFLVLLGPSGCGKTTTMRMIAGLEPLTAGEILIGGHRIDDRPARDRDIAMVFQNYGLYPHFTVAENIGYPLRIRNTPPAERAARVAAAAAKVDLSALLERRPKALSGGQRQRVALARAIVRQPNLFLMDEPLSNLDAILRVSMRAELKHLHHELGTTTIYVTHDQIEAMTLASRVAVMNGGVIEQLGPPREIYEDPQNLFVARFIGTPPMNLIRGTLAAGGFVNDATRIDGFGEAHSGEVVLGIRPDRVALAEAGEGELRGRVFSVEYTGSGLQVTVKAGAAQVTVLADLTARPSIDEAIGVRFERSAIYVFDAESGRRLRIDAARESRP